MEEPRGLADHPPSGVGPRPKAPCKSRAWGTAPLEGGWRVAAPLPPPAAAAKNSASAPGVFQMSLPNAAATRKYKLPDGQHVMASPARPFLAMLPLFSERAAAAAQLQRDKSARVLRGLTVTPQVYPPKFVVGGDAAGRLVGWARREKQDGSL